MQVNGISAEYVTRTGIPVKAVDSVSFTLEQGEVLGIAGESGCGKSTLASVLSGNNGSFLRITAGDVTFEGSKTIDLVRAKGVPRTLRGTTISLLPQRALNSLNPTARIGDFAYDVVRAHDKRANRREALEMTGARLERLGLPRTVLQQYPHQLSGGMRQRVVTVISTILNPQILIADEPTSALDVSSQKALVLMMQEMIAEGMLSRAMFITHDLALLSNIATKIAIMYAGRFVEENTTGNIVQNPQHPYTRALLASALEPDPRIRGTRIVGLTGQSPNMQYPPMGCRFHPRCPHAMPVCSQQDPMPFSIGYGYAKCWLLDPAVVADQTTDVEVGS